MKKLMMILLSAALLVSLAGCSGKGNDGKSANGNVEGQDMSAYVTLANYKGLDSGVTKQEVTEEQIEQELASFLGFYAEQADVTDRPAEMGDICSIDYSGKMDGVQFEGGTGSYDLPLGSGSFIPGFEEGVVGMNIGETKDITVTFPDPYRNNPDFSGKEAVFTVTLKSIKAPVDKELTDELVAANSAYATVDELRESIRTYYAEMYDQQYRSDKEAAIMKAVTEASTFKSLPESMVTYYTDYYRTYVEQMAASYNMTLDQFLAQSGMNQESYQKWLDESVDQSTKGWVIYQAIAQAEGITVEEAAVDELIAGYAAQNSQSADEFMQANSLDREEFRFSALAEKVADFLIENNN